MAYVLFKIGRREEAKISLSVAKELEKPLNPDHPIFPLRNWWPSPILAFSRGLWEEVEGSSLIVKRNPLTPTLSPCLPAGSRGERGKGEGHSKKIGYDSSDWLFHPWRIVLATDSRATWLIRLERWSILFEETPSFDLPLCYIWARGGDRSRNDLAFQNFFRGKDRAIDDIAHMALFFFTDQYGKWLSQRGLHHSFSSPASDEESERPFL